MKKLLFTAILVVCLLPLTAFSFSGSLSTADGGVVATGYWADQGFKISWDVSTITDLGPNNGAWFYQYWLTDLQGNAWSIAEPSHLTLEISPDVPTEYFWGFNITPVEFGDKDGISTAMKMDNGGSYYSFYSWQVPVWGDFYSKDGTAGGLGWNTAYNAGFYDADPTDAAADGSIGNKILRPDTVTEIPEPGTMLLFGMGLVGAGVIRRVRKK